MANLWALPGPARFAVAVRAKLDRGYSPVAVLPSRVLSDNAFCAGLIDAIDYSVDVIDDSENGARPLASLIADRFSIRDIPVGPDAPSALGRHEELRGRTLAVVVADDDQQNQCWSSFARPFVAASRTVSVAERPRLVILGSNSCAAVLADSDPLLSGIWWWGVLDRLDTALHLRRHLAEGYDELLSDCIVEVAGFDLPLAEHLAGTWDGSATALSGVLASFTGAPPATPPRIEPLPHSSTPLSAPPADLLRLWNQGLVDRWDTFPAYLHACAVPTQADLRSRVWRAQIRALMPTIDEERARIEVWLRRLIKGLPDDEVLEPGDLYALVQSHPYLKTWRGGHRKRLVYWLRDTRNTLAHLETLTPAEVTRGRRLISEDRRHG